MTTKKEKEAKLIKALNVHALYSETSISRTNLKKLIMRELDISDCHSVNSWILKLLSEGIIIEQPKGFYPQKEPRYKISIQTLTEVCSKTPLRTTQKP